MRPLDKTLRKKLEKTVIVARDIAEAAARAALEHLGVGEASPYTHLSNAEQSLRRKLRIHGRQLGDRLSSKTKRQEILLLITEVAYEHWHRMLFARFLAENNLLMYPDPDEPVAVSLEECEDLAIKEGAKNGWELASIYAARMLPQIFRIDSPVLQLVLPPEHQQKLERLVTDLPKEVFSASDSLGWVYQFWQARKKDEVNKSEVKIGARELPAVTQLFTEPYMVAFLLDNSLGAWWAARRLMEGDLKNAETEDELRSKASLPGVPLEYLRFVKSEDGKWTPAAGTFKAWPEHLSELKTLDPCCGSGHFLVAAFLMLVPMRMEMEGLSTREAVDAVLRDNLHGLEIDKRCVELAAFNLALTAWRYPNAGGYRPLPELNVACSGLSVSLRKEEWQRLANGNHNMRIALGLLHDEFQNAPILGSLLNPSRSDAAKLVDWQDLARAMKQALTKERTEEEYEAGVAAQGLAKAATLLAGQYHWVVTNVPYLARGKQDEQLKDFCAMNYKEGKNDLANVFLDRCLEFSLDNCTTSLVLPQNWLFLASYRKYREKLLVKHAWHLLGKLGAGAFETIGGEVVKAILFIVSRNRTFSSTKLFHSADCPGTTNIIRGLDASNKSTCYSKAKFLQNGDLSEVSQDEQLENPGSKVSLEPLSTHSPLDDFAIVSEGLHTGDYPRFGRKIWEIGICNNGWSYQQGGATTHSFFSGMEQVLFWEGGKGALISFVQERLGTETVSAWIKGESVWGRSGVVVGAMGNLKASAYTGVLFTHGIYAIAPKEYRYSSAIAAFCISPEFNIEARKLDQKVCIARDSIAKASFNLEHWNKVAKEKYPNGLPKPYSDDPTQWIFHGHPALSDEPLQVAVARLLGYRWPAEVDNTMELSDEARALVKKSEALLSLVDDDGIVCIPPVRGEASAAERLLNLLAAAYGDEWNNDIFAQLLKQVDHAGKTLETWLRDKFFIQHCKLFHNRPFIWHIWCVHAGRRGPR